jgi:hypothetical protein
MTARTFRFYGKAFSKTGTVNVTATFNEIQIHSGPIVTVDSSPPGRIIEELDLLFEYTGITDLLGNIPLELSVTNGTLFFGTVEANYSGNDEDTPPENYWGDVNSNSIETDGKNNVKINGVDQSRVVVNPDETGDWYYSIPENGTLTCDIFVDPDIVVTE